MCIPTFTPLELYVHPNIHPFGVIMKLLIISANFYKDIAAMLLEGAVAAVEAAAL
jgi:6,7-dimethyl-8-ribityllumazine synthase